MAYYYKLPNAEEDKEFLSSNQKNLKFYDTNQISNSPGPNIKFDFSKYVLIELLDVETSEKELWKELGMDKNKNVIHKRMMKDSHRDNCRRAIVIHVNVTEAEKTARRLHRTKIGNRYVCAVVIQELLSDMCLFEKQIRKYGDKTSQQKLLYVCDLYRSREPAGLARFLRETFSPFGTILSVLVCEDPDGYASGEGVIRFAYLSETFAAELAYDQFVVGKERLTVTTHHNILLSQCDLRVRLREAISKHNNSVDVSVAPSTKLLADSSSTRNLDMQLLDGGSDTTEEQLLANSTKKLLCINEEEILKTPVEDFDNIPDMCDSASASSSSKHSENILKPTSNIDQPDAGNSDMESVITFSSASNIIDVHYELPDDLNFSRSCVEESGNLPQNGDGWTSRVLGWVTNLLDWQNSSSKDNTTPVSKSIKYLETDDLGNCCKSKSTFDKSLPSTEEKNCDSQIISNPIREENLQLNLEESHTLSSTCSFKTPPCDEENLIELENERLVTNKSGSLKNLPGLASIPTISTNIPHSSYHTISEKICTIQTPQKNSSETTSSIKDAEYEICRMRANDRRKDHPKQISITQNLNRRNLHKTLNTISSSQKNRDISEKLSLKKHRQHLGISTLCEKPVNSSLPARVSKNVTHITLRRQPERLSRHKNSLQSKEAFAPQKNSCVTKHKETLENIPTNPNAKQKAVSSEKFPIVVLKRLDPLLIENVATKVSKGNNDVTSTGLNNFNNEIHDNQPKLQSWLKKELHHSYSNRMTSSKQIPKGIVCATMGKDKLISSGCSHMTCEYCYPEDTNLLLGLK